MLVAKITEVATTQSIYWLQKLWSGAAEHFQGISAMLI
jgi:hypothetical protein